MKLFTLILRIFVLVACVLLIFGGQTVLAHDDDEGELEEELEENATQDSLESANANGTIELY